MNEAKSSVEIENKYLLKALPSETPDEIINIQQFYVKNENGVWERARQSESNVNGVYYTHTIKTFISKGENKEDEKTMSESEFNTFVDKARNTKGSKYLLKTRNVFKDENLKWEIDDFRIMGYVLIIAEIEIPYKKFKVKKPDFLKGYFIMDVTKNSKFSNRSLAKYMYIR